MLRKPFRSIAIACLGAGGVAHAEQADPLSVAAAEIDPSAANEQQPGFQTDGTRFPRTPWIDRLQRGFYETVYLSAMRIDGMFGPLEDERIYERSSGSIAPALLWDEHDGFQPKMRFQVNLPLPRLDERFSAFVGRVDPDEYVSERTPQSGALPRQLGIAREDQTLLGIGYRDRRIKRGWHFDADAGVRVRFPLDPFVKAGYRYQSGRIDGLRLTLKETAFWQNSEELGFTSRIDLDRFIGERTFLRWTGSGTVSQESSGVRGYTEVFLLRSLADRRALAWSVDLYGETDAPVELQEFGTKVAFRQSIARQWLVLELRTGVFWPKDMPGEPRAPSWGVGVGLEMFFGTDEFLARPITF
ncbi:MAG: hypothetical protein ACRETT_01125 [Steroidobacteraceae bacterium]